MVVIIELLFLTWMFIGFMSYIYGVNKFGAPFYGFGHLMFWIIIGPIGLYLNIRDRF